MDEENDAASNPKAEEHLPVSGEFDAMNVPRDNPLSTDILDDDTADPNDMNALSAKRTDQIEEAPNPDGPANPAATSDKTAQSL